MYTYVKCNRPTQCTIKLKHSQCKIKNKLVKQLKTNEQEKYNDKLAPYGTDGRLFVTDVSAKFKVT